MVVEPHHEMHEAASHDRQLIASCAGERIATVMRDGQKVWIKRQGIERRPFGKRLHAAFSFLLPAAFMRASPVRDAVAMNEQEVRKINAFAKAGIAVPQILAIDGPALMIADVGQTVQKRLDALRKTNPQAHDALLVECAAALGKAHASGLVHGRPHPRDMFLTDGGLGFFDFEEEPEAVMPLATAQARDAWLLFFQISAQAIAKDQTQDAAFSAWAGSVSRESLQQLGKLVRFFSIFITPLKLVRPIYLGGDGKRMLSAMEFLSSHLKKQAKT
ncbi:serine/threonine protein phosphatase [Bartonella sp. LJL80]